MQDLIDWMGDIWFVDETTTTHSVGYVSERYSYSGSTQVIKLPYEDTTLHNRQRQMILAVDRTNQGQAGTM